MDEHGSAFDVETPIGTFPLKVPLPGWYNVANNLAAVASGLLLDVPTAAIQAGIAGFVGVSGRMEKIDLGQPFEVFVDFAHTPNSLQLILEMVRERGKRRIGVVFGCNGLRDRQKRPLMGRAAGRFADRIYLTAEDPRTESLDAINAEIAKGLEAAGRRAGEGYFVVPDREEAIGFALLQARPGDLVIVTGKGHEPTQEIAGVFHRYNDRDVFRAVRDERAAS